MSGLPEITVAGTVVADPDLKYFNDGACVANFTIAANDRRFDRDRGEWVDASATFLRCSIWRKEAEHVTESLSQGDRVLATGVLKQNKWETETGEKRTAFEMAVTEVGPSLKFATAQITKARRSTPTQASGGGEGVPAVVEATSTDEPPF